MIGKVYFVTKCTPTKYCVIIRASLLVADYANIVLTRALREFIIPLKKG